MLRVRGDARRRLDFAERAVVCDVAAADFYWDTAKGEPQECPSGGICKEGGVVATIKTRPNNYRFSPESSTIYPCPLGDACRGSQGNAAHGNATHSDDNHGQALCASDKGYTGPLCAKCDSDYYHDIMSGKCVSCNGGSVAFSPVTIIALVVLTVSVVAKVALWLFPSLQCWGNSNGDGGSSIVDTVTRQGTMLFVTTQIITSLQEGREFQGGEGYPYPFSLILRAMEVVSLDLFNIFHLDCAANTNWSHKLVATTAIPIGLVAVALMYQAGDAAYQKEPFTLNGTPVKYALEYLFFFLPAISKTICSSFACTVYDEGEVFEVSYMTADLGISCDSDEYKFITSYAGLMVVILPLGVPIMMYMLLRSHRVAIESRATRKGTDEELGLDHLTLWFSRNDPLFWWYSIVDMMRRLIFTSIIMLSTSPTVQMQVALMVAIISVALSREVGAHWFASSDYLQYFCR
jgi:hypothetical protein